MFFDYTSLTQFLNAVSACAVIAGVVFVVFQLRQNAKLIESSNRQLETANRQVEASIQQNRQQAILSTIERFTDESFNVRRRKAREIIKKHQGSSWKEFSESEEDFLVRGFLGLYETTAYLVKAGIADIKMVAEGMGSMIVADWAALEPAVKYYRGAWKREDAYRHFEELERSVKKQLGGGAA